MSLRNSCLSLIVTARAISATSFQSVPTLYSKTTSSEKLVTLLLLASGLLIHEIGHASAAVRYGCKKIELGAGIYICFLVFYAELSEAWKLSRTKRAVIDSAGMYFQAIYTSILSIVYFTYPSPILFYATTVLNFSLILNLNPFLRLDGYWLASDLLGIANLRSESKKIVVEFFSKAFKIRNTNLQRSVYHSRSEIYLWIYACSTSLFTVFFTYFLANKIFDGFFSNLLNIITNGFKIQESSTLDWVVNTFFLLWNILFAYFVLYFFTNLALKSASFAKNVLTRNKVN